MSSDEEASDVLSATTSAVSSLPAGARQAEAHDRAKRARELHLYPGPAGGKGEILCAALPSPVQALQEV